MYKLLPFSILVILATGCTNSNLVGNYVGGGLSATATGTSANMFSEKKNQDRVGELTVVAGHKFNKNFAIEARGSKSITQEDTVEQTSVGLYAKPIYPFNEKVEVYGLVGITAVDVDRHNGKGVNFSKVDLGLGAGALYNVNQNVSVFVDYVNLMRDKKVNGKEYKSSSVTTGVLYNF